MKNVFAFVVLGAMATSGCSQESLLQPKRTPNRYLIPNSYVGWLHVEYERKNAPLLPIQKGFRVYNFPPSGILHTSSKSLEGWAKDEYFYKSPKGWKKLNWSVSQGNGMIWGGTSSVGGITKGDGTGKMWKIWTPPTENFFIGTWKQFYNRKSKPPQSKEEIEALK